MVKKNQINLKDESGYILITAIVMLAVVTVIGLAASRTSDIEVQIASNERNIASEFYEAEGSLIGSLESYATWLTHAFLSADESTASYSGPFDFDGDGIDDATIETRCITTAAASNSLSTNANDLPSQSHTGPPPSGSGFSMKFFEVRRYGVTATSSAGNTVVQTGVWKVFNKFE